MKMLNKFLYGLFIQFCTDIFTIKYHVNDNSNYNNNSNLLNNLVIGIL